MSDFDTATDDVNEMPESDTPEAEAEAAPTHKSSPTFGLQLVGDTLPDTQSNRGGGGRGPDMRICNLLNELAVADPRNAEGVPQWAMLAEYTTGNGAAKVITSIEEGERVIPTDVQFEFAERRWSKTDEAGKSKRVSGLFARVVA